MKQRLYLRMKKKIQAKNGQRLRVKDVCHLIPDQVATDVGELSICEIKNTQGDYFIIDVIDVCRLIDKRYPAMDLRHLGPTQTIVEIKKPLSRFPKWISVTLVWIVLFIGSGMTIMNFHTDVSMLEVHRRIYYLITGNQVTKPLILQIPYSIGIGAGMILFFNHLFKKKFSDEPSPMDLEIFQYQETIDQYVIDHERNKDGSPS